MKLSPLIGPERRRGAALFLVLVFVALISVMTVALLTTGQQEQSAAIGLQRQSQTDALTGSALNLVLGQLEKATIPEDPDEPVFWASQPGAVRTWKDDGKNGTLYKLYSSTESTVDLEQFPGWLDEEAQWLRDQWRADDPASQSRFADLNRPLFQRGPDGRIADLSFPIADPRAVVRDRVEGFSVSADALNGTVLIDDINARLPLPVTWLYQLADGSLGTLDENGRFQPGDISASTPSRENPIVARLAFWVDDESCKVNINTASEGLPWDTPRAVTDRDVDYARWQPVKNEVQRWPGHPATVSLSSVFFPGEILEPGSSEDKLAALYDFVPRVSATGSEDVFVGLLGKNRETVQFDDKPLFTNLDEAIFNSERNVDPLFLNFGLDTARLDRSRFFLTAQSRAPELTMAGYPRVCLWPLHRNQRSNSRRVTEFDRLISFCSRLDEEDNVYHFRREEARSQWDEYFEEERKRNSELAGYLEFLLEQEQPKCGGSFVDKYPETDCDYHAFRFLDFIRSINLHNRSKLASGRDSRPYQDNTIPGIASGFTFSPPDERLQAPDWIRDMEIDRFRLPGRDFTISEVAFVVSTVAHYKSEEEKIGPAEFFDPNSAQSLLPGEMALQVAFLFEGFCPEQGYPMVVPHLRLFLQNESLLDLEVNGSTFEHYPGEDPHPGHSHGDHNHHDHHSHTGSPLDGDWGLPPFSYGNYKPNWFLNRGVETRRPDNWVGWGGSGGFHIFTNPIAVFDTRENPTKETNVRPYALDSPRHGYYLQGFFRLSPEDVATGRVQLSADGGPLELDLNVQRTWVTRWDARQLLRLEFPMPLTVPLPRLPLSWESRATWQNRYNNIAHRALSEEYNPQDPYDKLFHEGDVVRSVVVSHGDYRIPHTWGRDRFNDLGEKKERFFVPHPSYFQTNVRHAHAFTPSGGDAGYYESATFASNLVPGANYATEVVPDFPIDPGSGEFFSGIDDRFLSTYGKEAATPAVSRDWNNGTGIAPDGAYTHLPDGGTQIIGGGSLPPFDDGNLPPYFHRRWDNLEETDTSPAPNRGVASAGMFGSLPSLPTSGVPWTTFLFRPDLSEGHIGAKWNSITEQRSKGDPFATRPSGTLAPPDHYLLDNFWMPVVLPYAISDRFSTAGKVNLNHQILPFTWVERSTALHAALKSEEILAIPSDAGGKYKDPDNIDNAPKWRHRLDAAATIRQLDGVFDEGDAFVSPSEICEHFLVPENAGIDATQRPSEIHDSMQRYWREHALTGDNSLEQPYTNLAAKLTTRSNIFRVHLLVQTLQKSRSTSVDTFDPEKDRVLGEQRTEVVVERFLDPEPDPEDPFPDYVKDPDAPSLQHLHRFRTLSKKRVSR
ncbi:MAG: Verru_Chthon cassette protein A [Verrucomicrobiota bacterium]